MTEPLQSIDRLDEPTAETMRQAGALQTVKATMVIPPKGPADLQPDAKILNRVLQMDGDTVARELPAEHQVIADGWRQGSLWGPYLAYMPEKDRLLLLYNMYFHAWGGVEKNAPVLSFSDDQGKTWSPPRYLRDMGFCREDIADLGNATALTHLGNGRVILDTGEFLSEKRVGFSDDFGETWRSAPLPKSADGFAWNKWDPYLADRDIHTGELKRLCDTGYSYGMEKAFAGAKAVVSCPETWHWRHDPENRGLMEEWYKEASPESWPRLIRTDRHWTVQGEPDGVGWYATRFEMPESGGGPLVMLFGAVDGDCDVFLDGIKVGEQKKPSKLMWNAPFHIPLAGGLAAGTHTTVIRVEKNCEADSNAGIHAPVRIVEGPETVARDDGDLMAHTFPRIRFSYDGGLTWPEEVEPPEWNEVPGVTVNEVSLCRAGNGTLIAACRMQFHKYPEPNFIDHHSGLGISLSRDNGYTWTKITELYDLGQMHPSMVLMPNGNIVMTYVVRQGWLSNGAASLDEDG
jgi:hypothetical protein